MGFVTVFTLPYDFENVAYNVSAGNYSAPFRSKIGYHIFKNLGERKALGTLRVAQILFALPPGYTDAQRNSVAATADTVYQQLQKGVSFDEMVKAYSNDLNSASNGGVLPEFGTGDYDQKFEQTAFALKTPGEISRPFVSNYGYHIIKLIEAKPVSTDPNDPVYTAAIKERILRDERLSKAKKELADKHLALINYRPAVYKADELWRYTDSFLANKKTDNFKAINDKTVLFSFAKQAIKAGDWVKFAKAIKALPSDLSQKSYPELMKEYIKITGDEYYKNHLEEYSPNYNQQVKEFKEANMLFGIMDKYVWSKANVDSVGLRSYYNKNKSKYQWSASADALIITCPTAGLATELQQKLKTATRDWRKITEAYEGKVTADSGRYELGQLPVVDRTNFTQGISTVPVKNETDGTYTFNVILKVYNDTEVRSFEDARGMVISDYQQVLEDRWISELKKKYPVKVNEAVLASIK
jgi:peptidyl-prolyl cis-trans isomerase SurA